MKIFGFNIRFPRFSSKERRRGERAKVFETLYVDFANRELQIRGTGEAHDVALGGVRFVTSKKLVRGTRLLLTLRFTPGVVARDELQTEGQVVRAHLCNRKGDYLVVCSLSDLDAAVSDQLQIFIRWLERQKEKYLFYRWGEQGKE